MGASVSNRVVIRREGRWQWRCPVTTSPKCPWLPVTAGPRGDLDGPRLRTYSGPGLLGKVLWVTPYPGIIESRVTPYTAHPGSTPRRPESTPSPYSPTAALIADAAARNRCKSRRTAPGRYTNRQLPRDFPAGASYVAISGENVAFSRESTLLRPTRPPFRARVGYSLHSPLLRAGRE